MQNIDYKLTIVVFWVFVTAGGSLLNLLADGRLELFFWFKLACCLLLELFEFISIFVGRLIFSLF